MLCFISNKKNYTQSSAFGLRKVSRISSCVPKKSPPEIHQKPNLHYSLPMISITVMIWVWWPLSPHPLLLAAPGTSPHVTPLHAYQMAGRWIVSETTIRVEYWIKTLQHFWNNVLVKTLPQHSYARLISWDQCWNKRGLVIPATDSPDLISPAPVN